MKTSSKISEFAMNVYRIVRKIPRGKTMTYKEVAARAGSPRAYRAVGSILGKNYDSRIPCHRVIRENGEIGRYNRGETVKIGLLRQEEAI